MMSQLEYIHCLMKLNECRFKHKPYVYSFITYKVQGIFHINTMCISGVLHIRVMHFKSVMCPSRLSISFI